MLRVTLAALVLFAMSACTDQDFVTDVPLRVVAATPTGASVDAAREATVVLTFSEKLDAATVADAIALESLGYPDAPTEPQPVAISAEYSDEPVPTVTLTPAEKLPFSTIFRVSVATTIKRARDGGPLPVAVTWSFRTVHPPMLRVEKVEPADGSSGVARDAVVRVHFSEPVDCATLAGGNAVLTESFDPHPHTAEAEGSREIAGSWECPAVDAAAGATLDGTQCDADETLCVVTFKPEDEAFLFKYSSDLKLALAGGSHADAPVASARATPYGGQLPADYEAAWHVVDPAPLSVVASLPGTGARGVARDASLLLTFSEPIDCATLAETFVTLGQRFDAHPRLDALAGTTEPVPGAWSCTDVAAEQRTPETCAASPELCQALFTPEAAFLYEWSSDVTLGLAGGLYEPGVAPAALTSVESARATTRGGQLPAALAVDFHVVDPPPVAVVAVAPAHGASGVERSPAITLTLSEPPACDSLNDAAIAALSALLDPHPRLTGSGGAVAGEWSCPAPRAEAPYACDPGATDDPCVLTFVPAAGVLPFEWSTSLALALEGGSFDAAARVLESTRATTLGGQLPTDFASAWRVLDPPPLALVAVSPADGATGLERSPVLKLTFSEPPLCASLADALIVTRTMTLDPHPRLAGLPATSELQGAWSCPPAPAGAPLLCLPGDPDDPCVATFTVDAAQLPFEASTVLNLALAGGDYADGQPLAGDLLFVESTRATTRGGELPSYAFVELRIEDPAPQLVVATSPAEGATGVAVAAAPIEVELSQPLACNTVNASTVTSSVTLADGTQGTYDFTLACTEGGRTVTLNPADASQPFPYSATFAIRLAGGAFAQDVPAVWPEDAIESDDATSRNGQLPSDYTFSFVTENPPPMLVKSTSPSGDGVGVDLTAPVAVAFSEGLDCTSLTPSTFTVTETFATPEDPDKATPAPAAATCSFVCPDAGDPAAMRCDHLPFAKSSVVEVALAGGAGPADSIRSAAATLNGGFLEAPPVVFSFRAQDPELLALSSTSPNGEPGANVSALSDVRFTFARAIRCETALTRFTLVDESAGAPVAGTLACTDGATVGTDVDGTTLVFTPSAPLTVDHTFRATALAGIAAADATVVDGMIRGKLEQDASISFMVAFEDLLIVSTVPSGTSNLTPIGTNVTLQFNQDIAAGSLKPCTPGVQADCNFWLNEGSTSNQAAAIDLGYVLYDNASFAITYDPSDAANAPHLKPDVLYTVTVLSGANGVVGTNGVSHLPVDYTFSFRTSSNALIVGLTPEIDQMDVEAWAPICVEFVDAVAAGTLTAGGNQITLTYEDAFGRTAQVPLDEANPYSIGDKSGLTGNYVCLNVTDAPIPCLAGMRRLLYASLYTVEVSTQVELVSGQSLLSPFAWDFMTRNPPEIAGLHVKNLVIDEPLVRGAEDVPVNAAIVIRFAEVMDPASLDPANLQLLAEGASTPVAITLVPDDPANPRAVMVTTTPHLDYLDAAADKGGYALLLLGGSGGLTTAAGNYLESDLLVRFETSPATHLTFSPPESEITPGIFVPLNSLDRPLHLASITGETVYATFNGELLGGIVAQNPLQPLSATYIAVPTYKPNQSLHYQFHTTAQVLDFRGNPVPAIDSVEHTTGNTASSTAITPLRAATYTDVSPRAPTATTDGDQSFTLTLPIAANQGLRDRFQGTSYYATEPGEPDGTVSLEALGGAGCPAAGTRLALAVQHLAGAATFADRVRIEVAQAPYMTSGCQYALKIRQYATANIYDSLSPVTVCNGLGGSPPTDIISSVTCAVGDPSPGMIYTAETTAPTLTSLEVQALDGSFIAADAATGVFGGTRIVATFSEAIDPASVSDGTFSLSNGVTGSYQVEGDTVIFEPSTGLAAGANYTVTIGGVADLAGNAYAGSLASFDIETAVPTFDAVAFDAAPTRLAAFGEVALSFSEPVDPATLTVNANLGLGSVSPAAAGTPLYGCATVDPADAKRVLWRPSEPLEAGVQVDVTVNAAGAAAMLTDRAGTEVVETTHSFTP